MQTIELDCTALFNREQLHDALAEALCFPAYYGRNLDALFDCLTDLRQETELHVLHPDLLEAHLGAYADAFLRVLQVAARENPVLSCR